VVAAIDFGTHGTGFAWASVSQENSELRERRISFFENWPGQKVSYAKNRSAVLLDEEGKLLSWGYAAVAMMDAMPGGADWRLQTGFKMSLRDTSAVPGTGAAAAGGRAGVLLAARAPDAYDLTVHCLKQVIAVARDQITRSAYEEDDILWCLTVPAMWDQYTRDTMFRAAVAAGLPDDPDRLVLAQEPAAAALYCAAKGEDLIRTPGTRFMVVDAGGGTVDITSYQVADDGRLNELAPASGAPTGADFINEAFVEEVLGGEFGDEILERILDEKRSAIAVTMEAWERAKRSFAPDTADDLVIQLSAPFYRALVAEQRAGRWRGTGEPPTEVVVGRELVAGLFDRSIDETLVHVEQHLSEMRALSGATGGEHALLVGGFAESRYLRARFGEQLAAWDVRVIVPEQPSVAVLAGAVHFAYDPSVFVSWRAPFTLGIEVAMPFEPGVDPEASKRRNYANQDVCLGRFHVFVTNRQSLATDKPVRHRFEPGDENQTDMELIFFATDQKNPRYVTDPGVTKVGWLAVDLRSSMHLPVERRGVEVFMYFGQTHVRAEARNVATDEPHSVEIKWQSTW
jgi:molecular chaperone DnaK (HSP70)